MLKMTKKRNLTRTLSLVRLRPSKNAKNESRRWPWRGSASKPMHALNVERFNAECQVKKKSPPRRLRLLGPRKLPQRHLQLWTRKVQMFDVEAEKEMAFYLRNASLFERNREREFRRRRGGKAGGI